MLQSAGSDARIAIFVPSLRLGGAERMMVNLAAAAVELGVPVDLVVADVRTCELGPLPAAARVHDLRARRMRTAVMPLVEYLRANRPFALFSRMNHANVVAVTAGRLSRVPTRVAVTEATHWNGWLREMTRPERLRVRWGLLPLMQWCYRRADAVIAVSDGVADELCRKVRLARERIQVVRNPVIDDRLLCMATEEARHPWLQEPRSAPAILAVGRLLTPKDYPTLLRAFAALRRRRDARLIVYGAGSERQTLFQLLRDLHLENSVDLPGIAQNPYAEMAACDLFVLSSSREGSPNVLVEALACGCRAVATDCRSGPAEVLHNGRLGTLVPVGDAAALAEAMDRQLDAPWPDESVRRQICDEYDSRTATLRYLAAVGHPKFAVERPLAHLPHVSRQVFLCRHRAEPFERQGLRDASFERHCLSPVLGDPAS